METTINSAANSKLLADGYAAFARGDLETMSTLFRSDMVWHAQRLGTLSGDQVGRDAGPWTLERGCRSREGRRRVRRPRRAGHRRACLRRVHARHRGASASTRGSGTANGPLTVADWEEVRLHPSHTERVLMRAECLQSIARIAAAHHERPDGSGYHRGLHAAGLPRAAQLLIGCDVYQAMTEDRPACARRGGGG